MRVEIADEGTKEKGIMYISRDQRVAIIVAVTQPDLLTALIQIAQLQKADRIVYLGHGTPDVRTKAILDVRFAPGDSYVLELTS